MILSKRLTAIASLVEKGSCVADVGCDHGYVPIYLVKHQIAVRAIAMDVRTGPLQRAAEHIKEYGVEDQIELRLGNGLDALNPGEADTVVISGMGGYLILDILTRGAAVADTIPHLILSPQSDIPAVRIFLRENGYRIEKEVFLKDEGKYYTIMRVCHGETKPGRYLDDLYGKYLLDHGDSVLQEYLTRQIARYEAILPGLCQSDKEETRKSAERIREELTNMRQAMAVMQDIRAE
jgi:tRNA (adenine22-N1)-methyltransferase